MNIINNALSAKNVKIHGMSSAKWTTKDKITQYKGLVNLYKRDRDITQIDTAIAAKRQYKGLVNLRKTIKHNRRQLENAKGGDRQYLRNLLADHRRLQLAYQNLDPKTVIENLHQINFTKRKVLDKLCYQLKQKSLQLQDLKSEEALLEDRLKYKHFDKLDLEKQAQIITGQVQNALLKKEAALAIQQTYSQITDVMKKDALYFDSVLLTIQNDYWYQCRCILNATKQGQLATEYKNDREQEFSALEKAVTQDMKTRKEDIKKMQEQAEKVQGNLKHLLRRDSDITTCVIEVEESKDFAELHRDLNRIQSSLKYLKDKTLVSSFELIYPSLEEQRKQKKRLNALVKKCERDRDIIMNKLNHAQLMRSVLETTMVETTSEYKKRKKELLELIETERRKKNDYDTLLTHKKELIAKIRVALRQLQQLCKSVQTSDEDKPSVLLIYVSSSDDISPPEEDEIDGIKIIDSLYPKLTYLMAVCQEKLDHSQLDPAYKYYEILMQEHRIEPNTEVLHAESFLEELTTEVIHPLTREDIKKQSAEIVAANSKDEDLVPIFTVKRRRNFK